MAAETSIATAAAYLKEELSVSLQELEPQVDPLGSKIYTTSKGVQRDATGRNFEKLVTFFTGLAGAFRNVAPDGPSTVDVDLTGQVKKWDTGSLTGYPGMADQAFPGTVQKKVRLVEGNGSISIPIHQMLIDQMGANLTSVVERSMRGFAKNIAQIDANHYYMADHTEKCIVVVADITALTNNASATVTFDMSDSAKITGRIGRLMPGMMVDGRDTSGSNAVLANAGNGVVTKVDWLAKTFVVYFSGGAVTFANGDYLSVAGTGVASGALYGPSGPEKWLVSSGTDVFNLNLTTHPQLKSLVAAYSGVLEEYVLNKYVGGFYEAYGGMYDLDSILTTTGVLNAWLESLDGFGRFQRQNQALKVMGGWIKLGYIYNGKEYEFATSRYQAPGQAYIMKTGENNIRRYVAPGLRGGQRKENFAMDIMFLGRVFGSSNIFLPHRDSSANLLNALQAPVACWREVAPEQIPGIKLTGLTESTI